MQPNVTNKRKIKLVGDSLKGNNETKKLKISLQGVSVATTTEPKSNVHVPNIETNKMVKD